MKAATPFFRFSTPFFLLSFCTSINAQSYQVVNKSQCEALVKIGCTDNSINQHIIQPNGFANGNCEVCFISIDFDDGNTGPEVVDLDLSNAPCASPMPFDLGSACYSGNIDWGSSSGWRTINFY